MKICKNCTTINIPEATTCIKCAMQGMMVDVKNQEKAQPSLKALYQKCTNCGIDDTGKGSHCNQCNFPLAQNKVEITSKVKRS